MVAWVTKSPQFVADLPTPAVDKAGRMQNILLGEWVKIMGELVLELIFLWEWVSREAEAEAVSKYVAQLKIKFPFVFWRQVESFQNWA